MIGSNTDDESEEAASTNEVANSTAATPDVQDEDLLQHEYDYTNDELAEFLAGMDMD